MGRYMKFFGKNNSASGVECLECGRPYAQAHMQQCCDKDPASGQHVFTIVLETSVFCTNEERKALMQKIANLFGEFLSQKYELDNGERGGVQVWQPKV